MSTGNRLKQSTIPSNDRLIVNICIAYELGASSSRSDDLALKNCLFGTVTLTKSANIDKIGIMVMELDLSRHFGEDIFWSRHEFFCSYR